MSIPCGVNVLTGKTVNMVGQPIDNCNDCRGCFSKSFAQDVGLIGDFRIKMIGEDVTLHWNCPSCKAEVKEDVLPINAIDLAQEIKKDPLCFSCRSKAI